MAMDVQPKAAPGTLWKPERHEKKQSQPLKRSGFSSLQKPMKQLGKVGKQRAADRKAKLKAEPPRHDGTRQCYIGNEWIEKVVLEHVIDASIRPDLRSNPSNQRWACAEHNMAKKNGTLTMAEEARVQDAIKEVLDEVE